MIEEERDGPPLSEHGKGERSQHVFDSANNLFDICGGG